MPRYLFCCKWCSTWILNTRLLAAENTDIPSYIYTQTFSSYSCCIRRFFYLSQPVVPHRAPSTCTASKPLTLSCSKAKNNRKNASTLAVTRSTRTDRVMSAHYKHQLQIRDNIWPPTACKVIEFTFPAKAFIILYSLQGVSCFLQGQREKWDEAELSVGALPVPTPAMLHGPGRQSCPAEVAFKLAANNRLYSFIFFCCRPNIKCHFHANFQAWTQAFVFQRTLGKTSAFCTDGCSQDWGRIPLQLMRSGFTPYEIIPFVILLNRKRL